MAGDAGSSFSGASLFTSQKAALDPNLAPGPHPSEMYLVGHLCGHLPDQALEELAPATSAREGLTVRDNTLLQPSPDASNSWTQG